LKAFPMAVKIWIRLIISPIDQPNAGTAMVSDLIPADEYWDKIQQQQMKASLDERWSPFDIK
jgi:hypothetical protein